MLEIRSVRDLLRLFFIFRREFQWAVITTIVVAILGAFLLPAKYESNARLLVKPGRDSTTMPIEVANRQALIAPSTQRDPIVDEEKMLTGRPIVRQVAERYLEEMANYKPQGFWKTIKFYVGMAIGNVLDVVRSGLQLLGIVEQQSEVDRLAAKLEKNFVVAHDPGSAVMQISFTWSDPSVAQKVVDTWIKAFLEERTQALGRKSLYTFYDAEMLKVADQVTFLKKQLHQQLTGIKSISVEERLDNLTNQINRLSDAQAEKLNEQAGIRSFLNDARVQIKRQPYEVITAREVSLNPTDLDLKRRINTLEQERTALLRTYLPDAPPVREIEQNLQQMRDLDAKHAERLERSQNLAPNGIVVNLKQQIIDAELRATQLSGQLKDYNQQLQFLRTERERVLRAEPDITRLNLQLVSAEKSYALYAENLEKARIDRELDKSQISNIAIIEQATFNPSRVFPKSLMILLLAVPAGLAVGLLTLYLCYLLDQRIHDGERIEATFGAPLWSTLQDLGERPWQPQNAFIASIYRLYSLLPFERIEQQGLALALTSARSGEGVSFVIEQLRSLLVERGHRVRVDGSAAAEPGEIVLLRASALLSNQQAFITLRQADMIALVIEAKASTIPMVQHALATLNTAFGKVDGIILNRRQFEIPASLLELFNRWRGQLTQGTTKQSAVKARMEPVPPTIGLSALETTHTGSAQAFISTPFMNSAPAPALAPAPELAPGAPDQAHTTPATSTVESFTWGSRVLLEQSPRHRLLRLCIAPGASLPMHYHLHRSKHWIVLSGLALWESNGEQQRLRAGDRVEIVMEQAHSIRNLGVIEVQLYEMQFGEYFGDDDITVVESARA